MVSSSRPFLIPRKYKAIDWQVGNCSRLIQEEIHIQTSKRAYWRRIRGFINLLTKYPLMSPVNSGGSGSATSAARRKPVTQNHAEVQPNNVSRAVTVTWRWGKPNHILQFPRQPKRDDGKWVAIGSLIGSLLGKIASSVLWGRQGFWVQLERYQL